jgi:hypothetical protein
VCVWVFREIRSCVGATDQPAAITVGQRASSVTHRARAPGPACGVRRPHAEDGVRRNGGPAGRPGTGRGARGRGERAAPGTDAQDYSHGQPGQALRVVALAAAPDSLSTAGPGPGRRSGVRGTSVPAEAGRAAGTC